MATNEQLKNLMALDLGIDLSKRDALATEVFKHQDIQLLPHSSTDTMIGEIFENNGTAWHTRNQNILGYLFSGEQLQQTVRKVKDIPKADAQIPAFVFSKDHIISLGLKIPALFNIGFSGNLKNSKDFSVKVTGVTKQRIDNISSPGMEIYYAFSSFMLNKTKTYRQKVKFNHIGVALFYADSVEISLDKSSGADVDFNFDAKAAKVDVVVENDSRKVYRLTYSGNQSPFAASLVKGKDFGI